MPLSTLRQCISESKQSTCGKMASSNMRLLAALCSLIVFTSFISSTQSASCCLRYSKHLPPCRRLLGYTIQTINTSCDIPAIIFHAPRRFVCADPSKKETQEMMSCVEAMKKQNGQITKEKTPATAKSA